MRFARLHRIGLALWLGLLALTASGLAQNQLSTNVLRAALAGHSHDSQAHEGHHDHGGNAHASGGHFMPDGTYMAGPMHGAAQPDAGGHTNKGHADCNMCGAVAAMASISVPVADTVIVPRVFDERRLQLRVASIIPRALYAPYASRAPPLTAPNTAA